MDGRGTLVVLDWVDVVMAWTGLDWKVAGGLGWGLHNSITVVRGVLSIEME